jgi:hypothetical protein
MCPNYRRRYHPAVRMRQAVDTSTAYLGFGHGAGSADGLGGWLGT